LGLRNHLPFFSFTLELIACIGILYIVHLYSSNNLRLPIYTSHQTRGEKITDRKRSGKTLWRRLDRWRVGGAGTGRSGRKGPNALRSSAGGPAPPSAAVTSAAIPVCSSTASSRIVGASGGWGKWRLYRDAFSPSCILASRECVIIQNNGNPFPVRSPFKKISRAIWHPLVTCFWRM